MLIRWRHRVTVVGGSGLLVLFLTFCRTLLFNYPTDQEQSDIREDRPPCGALVVSHWMPHILLWLCIPLVGFYMSLTDHTPRNRLYFRLYRVRIVLAIGTLVSYLAEFLYDLSTWNQWNLWVAAASGLVNIVSLAMVGVLATIEMRRGHHPSVVPFGFWFLTICAEFTPLRSLILQDNHSQIHRCDNNAFHIVRLSLVIASFTWCMVTDILLPTRLFMANLNSPTLQKINSYETTNLLSRVTFVWMLRKELKALRNPISLSDLFYYLPEHGCKNSLSKLDLWIRRQTKHGPKNGLRPDPPRQPRLMLGILRLVLPSLLPSLFARCLGMTVRVTQLFLLRDLIKYLEIETSADRDLWWGLYLVGRLAVTNLLSMLLNTHYFYSTHYASARIRGICSALVIRKFLSLPAARRQSSIGNMTSYMTVDVQKLADIFSEANCGFEVLILGPAAILVLWQAFGPSCVMAVFIYLALVLVNIFPIRKALQRIKADEMKTKVQRIGLIQSILSGIKVLKFNAWEEIYEEKVLEARKRELGYIQKSISFQAASNCFSLLAPYMVTTSALLIYVLISPSHVVSSEKIFVAMTAVDNTLIFSIYLPIAATYIAQGWISGKRLMTFLQTEEDHYCPETKGEGFTNSNGEIILKDGSRYTGVPQQELNLTIPISESTVEKEDVGHVSVAQASFTWGDPSSPTLQCINLEVQSGQCVAVVGSVGAGKSSLLTALLGELTQLSGTRIVTGNIVYVPQEPWIRQTTLRDNITLGNETSMDNINQVIHACALEADLQTLPDGLHTDIGERGVTLSGGQKQRVSLARAIYADADVYLLDDPLSAVDVKVAKHLFEQVIGPNGLLRHKTRILVTHALQWLPLVDLIVIMEAGRVIDSGTYAELESRPGLLTNHFHLKNEEDPDRPVHRTQKQGLAADKDTSMTPLMTVELMEHQQKSLSTLMTYARSMGRARATLILLLFVLLAVTMSACSIWVTLWSADWKANAERAASNAHYRLGVYVGLGALHTTVLVVGLLFVARSSLVAARSLHDHLLHRLLRATPVFFDTTPGGRVLNWFTKDMDDVDIAVLKEMLFLVYAIPAILSMLTISSYVVPASLLLTIPMLVVFIGVQRLYSTYVRQVMRVDGVAKSPVFSFFDETVRGVVSIRAFQKENHFCDTFYRLVDASTRPMWHLAAAKALMTIAICLVSTVMCLCISTLCVVFRDRLDSALCAVAIYCTMQGMFTLQSFIRHTASLERALVAVERISSHNHIIKEAPWRSGDNTTVDPKWPKSGSIRFEHYSTTYRPELELCLRDISFTINASEKVGIVGRTGAGKTSLTLALLRMIESYRGKIYIDEVDISQMGLHDLRSKVTVITQDPVLFEGSVRENLDPGGNHGDQQLWEALEHAHLKDFVTASPGGLSWYCGDAGELLSVGQRQLLCLARALLRRSKILVLDEPTAAVDMRTDHLVQETLKMYLGHCTLLTIAHRINTIMDYDRVMLLETGRIVEFDSPPRLLADKHSRFYSLALEAGLVS